MQNGIISSTRESRVYLFALLASLFLSYWIGIHQTVVNPDAICYLYSAEAFGKSGLHDAMHLCPQAIWPFYSVLTYGIAAMTGLSLTASAFSLNAVFTAISVLLFITIIKQLGASTRVLWFAAITILLAHEFNSVRQYIIRDHGYWVCYLASFSLLLRYFKRPTFQVAIMWGLVLLVGTLFRIEGAVFLIVLPMTIWLYTSITLQERFNYFLQMNTVLLVVVAVLGIWFLAHPEAGLTKLGRVGEVPNQFQHGTAMMWAKYTSTQAAVTQNVLSHVSERDAGLVVVLTLFIWYLVNVINNLSWINAFLVGYAWYTRAKRFAASDYLVMMSYLIVNLAVTASFFAENLFLAKRYLIALSLILMLWVPFALEKLYSAKNKILFLVAILAMITTTSGVIISSGSNKEYIREAGDWLAQHIPADAKLYANDYQLMYYSKHFGTQIFTKIHEYVNVDVIANNQWKKYDYLALRTSKDPGDKAAQVIQEIRLQPVQVFMNEKGDGIYIFKVWQVKAK